MSSTDFQGITDSSLNPVVPSFDPREAWLQGRRRGIGSSDASSLYSEGYGCYKRLILDKRDTPHDFLRTPEEENLLSAGHKLEDTVAREFIDDCNEKLNAAGLKPFGIRRVAPKIAKDNPDLRANIDRQITGVTAESLYHLFPSLESTLGTDPGPGIMEVKTTNKFVLTRTKHEGATLDWILQVQEQFGVVPHRWALIVAKARDTWETLAIPILPQADLIADISRRATEAMELVRNDSMPLPPPLEDPKDKRCSNCVYRKSCRGDVNAKANSEIVRDIAVAEVDDSQELADLLNDYKSADFQYEDSKVLREAIAERIKDYVGDKQLVRSPNAQAMVKFTTVKGRETVDAKALRSELPDVYSKYLKVGSPSKRFEVVCE